MSSRLRVLSVAHTAVSRAAGRLRYAPLAAHRDLDVHLVAPARWHQFGRWQDADPSTGAHDDPGVTMHVLPTLVPRAGPAKWYMHWYPGLAALVRRLQPDVLHFWEEPWSVVALQGAVLARRSGAALVLEVDQNLFKPLPPPFSWIRRHVLKNTAMVLSRSPDASSVVRKFGYTGPVHDIGYGVDQSVFTPAAKGPAGSPLRLGYVGRIVVEKGLDDAVEAMARADVPVELAIMGEGPHEGALRQRAAALGLERRISFQRWGDPAEVARFIQGLHALVLLTRTTPAVREQFGRVILEAQSCGVPVIGSTCGAIPNVIGPGGWVIPEQDPAALAQLIERLARSPSLLAEGMRDGLANIDARFTFPAVAAALATAWRDAAGRRTVADQAPSHGKKVQVL